MKIENDHGLLIDVSGPQNHLVGYLFSFEGKGIYSPDGKVEVTQAVADEHNKLLSIAEIAGLDKAEVGQWGSLYYTQGKGVHTWIGAPVSNQVTINGRSITFDRNGRRYRGTLHKDSDMFNFKRIS